MLLFPRANPRANGMIITTDHVQSLFSLPWHFLMGVDGGFINKLTILVSKTMVLGMKPPNQCLEPWYFWRLPLHALLWPVACLPAGTEEDWFHGTGKILHRWSFAIWEDVLCCVHRPAATLVSCQNMQQPNLTQFDRRIHRCLVFDQWQSWC